MAPIITGTPIVTMGFSTTCFLHEFSYSYMNTVCSTSSACCSCFASSYRSYLIRVLMTRWYLPLSRDSASSLGVYPLRFLMKGEIACFSIRYLM